MRVDPNAVSLHCLAIPLRRSLFRYISSSLLGPETVFKDIRLKEVAPEKRDVDAV